MPVATFILWALAIAASILGMGVREGGVLQGLLNCLAIECGAAGLIVWLVLG